ncbi:MAG: DNA-directed RNA polymerase subunit A' [Candidatus Micrarchaeota archaeon]|nr:DNA-directed RNA polymerase subunit A' [Candidatus Micrarchaeota archaeon]
MRLIEKVEFSVFSPEQVRKMSSVKITVPDTYDEDGYPIQGGLADQRLGVIDPGLKCKSCGGRMKSCTGHFGHIELVRPVVHVGFGKMIYQLLKAVCRKCSRVMTNATDLESVKRAAQCPHCSEKQVVIKFVKPTNYYEGDRKLLPNETRERLERIPDQDLKQLGVAIRPELAVLTVLLVPPVNVRPSITLETGERSEDDLTHKLVDIIRINQRLGENIDAGAPQLIIEDLWELLQYHVVTYYDNETAGIPPARHRSGRQLKTLFQRLKGKEGRFRYNLSGKRVNFSARTVISPDPTLSINQLGVPQEIASELTIPVSVTEWNLEIIKNFVRVSPEKINYVIRPDNRRKKLTTANLEEVLKEITPGYQIERQLINGDLVIFNRQPSLHRVSMMCHEVKILPGKTFRFNVADCAPYNADYDGDEMNVHVPQNEEAQSEAEILMKVQGQILSPRHGKPLISPSLDHLSGLYLLTNFDYSFDRDEAFEILSQSQIEKSIEGKKITGQALYSMIFPPDFSAEFINRSKTKTVIRKGQLIEGTIDSKVSNAIVRELFLNYGADTVRKYIDEATRISSTIVKLFGLSLSLDDYSLNEIAQKQLAEIVKESRKKVRMVISKYRKKTLERQPGKTLRETLEEQIMEVLEEARSACNKLTSQYIKHRDTLAGGKELSVNSALMMSNAGARGSKINVIQMAALVGQQAIRGKRATSGYKSRILPHFRKGDLSDQARGFVDRSFKDGLTPVQYFFHAAGGRDSVVDKGVNPAKTGYMQRRLVNAIQDFIVKGDLSVRDAEGRVIQFKYGDDALDITNGKKIAYGEPVGVLAAQSIGEPGTQMTLRTFHYAGVASLAQLGFTRLVEIVDGRKTPKKPVMEVYLKAPFNKDYARTKQIAAEIEQVTLEKVAEVREDFEKKAIQIKFNEEMLKEHAISIESAVEKIKLVAPYEGQGGKTITVKPKVDTLRNVRKITNRLRTVLLKGIEGINRAIIIEKEGSEYTLATEGSNLQEVFKIEAVDTRRTTTNDVAEISRVLGIEAGRNAIIVELLKVMDAQDMDVDMRHIMLIADSMTSKGLIESIGRHGLAGKKDSVLARAAFEETAKHLTNACIRGEEDKLRGITENIIIGQTIPCGTGEVELEMDVE